MKAKLLFVLIISLPCFYGEQINSYKKALATNGTFTLGFLGFALRENQSFKNIAKKVVISALTYRAGFLLFFNVIQPRAR